jgi:hypothetical protein
MPEELRTHVTFKSDAFNTREDKPNFINPGNFGDDVAAWVGERLRAQGLQVEPEVGQEDFGWYVAFQCGGTAYTFVLGSREDESGDWLGWLERHAGFLASIFGGRDKGIKTDALEAIHTALSGAPEIRDVRWHTKSDMFGMREERGCPTPTG